VSDQDQPNEISPAMIRAARALLGLEQSEVAEKAGLTQRTISNAERGLHASQDPRRLRVLEALKSTFDREGVEFFFPDEFMGEGVRRRKTD
jgi:transcriptional regulator with XRE-family HTH domain